jgi:uncharacterized membrane protein
MNLVVNLAVIVVDAVVAFSIGLWEMWASYQSPANSITHHRVLLSVCIYCLGHRLGHHQKLIMNHGVDAGEEQYFVGRMKKAVSSTLQ